MSSNKKYIHFSKSELYHDIVKAHIVQRKHHNLFLSILHVTCNHCHFDSIYIHLEHVSEGAASDNKLRKNDWPTLNVDGGILWSGVEKGNPDDHFHSSFSFLIWSHVSKQPHIPTYHHNRATTIARISLPWWTRYSNTKPKLNFALLQWFLPTTWSHWWIRRIFLFESLKGRYTVTSIGKCYVCVSPQMTRETSTSWQCTVYSENAWAVW